MLFFMAVSVPVFIPSCEKSSPTGPGNGQTGITVNTPTNKYFVSIIVINLGGLGGCGTGTVSRDSANNGTFSESINDAQVTVNSTKLDTMSGMPGSYSAMGIDVTAGTHYSLLVTRAGATIATGAAIMPSQPVISVPAHNSYHALNTPLAVAWSAIQYATSVAVNVVYSDTSSGTDTTLYESDALQPTATSCTVPQTVFAAAGTYSVNVFGYYGIPPGQTNIDSTAKGYNITGPAGLFVAASSATDTVYVNASGAPKIAMRTGTNRADSPRDRLLRVARKWFPRIF